MVAWANGINNLINKIGLNRQNTTTDPPISQELFNLFWDLDGITDEKKLNYRHFDVRLSPSGMLTVIGSKMFWNNFYIA